MPKLHISIHIDQNGQQAIDSNGDPSLWPLVGRLAAAASQIQQSAATVVINNVSDRNAHEHHQGSEHKVNTALATLGWSGFGDIQRWAKEVRECALRGEEYLAARAVSETTAAPIRERQQLPESTTPLEVLVALDAELANKVRDAKGFEAQVDLIDEILRSLVASEDDDGPEQVANLVAERVHVLEDQDSEVRKALEEAIGRTPDPSRSTLQLVYDLAEVLKAAVAAR